MKKAHYEYFIFFYVIVNGMFTGHLVNNLCKTQKSIPAITLDVAGIAYTIYRIHKVRQTQRNADNDNTR